MMDARTEKALHESIKHWEENVAAETPEEASIGQDDCALCSEFNTGNGRACRGCPVKEATGQQYCKGSPYRKAVEALQYWQAFPDNAKGRDAFRKAAQAEVDFLKGLLP